MALLENGHLLLLGGSLLGLELTCVSSVVSVDLIECTEVANTVSWRGTERATPVEGLIVDQLGRAHTASDLKVGVLVIQFLL